MAGGRVLITPRSLQMREGRHHPALERLLEAGWEPVYPEGPGPFGPEVLRSLVAGIHGALIGLDFFDRSVVQAATELRVVARFGAGYDRVDLRACTERGVVVTNTPDANTIAVAEATLALILAAARRVVEHHQDVLEGRWQPRQGMELAGRRLGLIGLGRIGSEVARRARALGMEVVYYDVVRKDPALERSLGVTYTTPDDLLAGSDVISLHASHLPGSPPLLGARELGLMREGAILVNTARGELVDEVALAEALRQHRLRAALDVFSSEPLPAAHPLVGAPNLILAPHAAAHTREATERMASEAVQSVLDVLSGRRPGHVVNPEVYGEAVLGSSPPGVPP